MLILTGQGTGDVRRASNWGLEMRCWPPRGDARLSVHVWLRRQRKGRVPGYVRAALRDWRSRLCPPVSSGLHRCGTPNEALHCRSCVDVRPPLGARERRTAPAWHTNIRLATVLVGKSRPSRACRCAAGAPASAGVSSVSDGQGISTEGSRTGTATWCAVPEQRPDHARPNVNDRQIGRCRPRSGVLRGDKVFGGGK
jgi:hypothetical protein